ncbi:hypothetical protein ACFL2H_06875 [Planctomycetota bacterium]
MQDFTDRRAELDDQLHREFSDVVSERTELDIQAIRSKILDGALGKDTDITGLLQERDVKQVMDIPLPTPVPDTEPDEPPAED